MKNKTIAITGTPGCGKTANAVKLAAALSKRKLNVILISLDHVCPAIPYLLPNPVEHETSLGALLAMPGLSQDDIYRAMVPVPGNRHASMLGYRFGDNLGSHPKPSGATILTLFTQLQHIAPYLVIDCAPDIEANEVSQAALGIADMVVCFVSPDLKGLSHHGSHRGLVSRLAAKNNGLFAGIDSATVTMASNCRPGQSRLPSAAWHGDVLGVLPHCAELARQYDDCALWQDLTEKQSAGYAAALADLMEKAAPDPYGAYVAPAPKTPLFRRRPAGPAFRAKGAPAARPKGPARVPRGAAGRPSPAPPPPGHGKGVEW